MRDMAFWQKKSEFTENSKSISKEVDISFLKKLKVSIKKFVMPVHKLLGSKE